ncbi:MAG: hypothetical protein HY331_01830 [Chloroflexi bacterium]|nr:hypothetical protein [Chloroflexota bacterium]
MLALERLWDGVSEIAVDGPLICHAGDLAERPSLRAYDAVHLAALRQFGEPGDVTFVCWGADLRRAAQTFGYALIPA